MAPDGGGAEVTVGSFFFDAGAIILLLFVVVIVHEGGHFVFAKLSGVQVDEFAIGFGPRLLAKKWGDTVYAIRAIPAGGFVRMAGMLGLEGESDAGERNFYRASIPKRFITIAAGVIFNFVFAAGCFAAVYMQPNNSHVLPASPAYNAGLRDGDVILSVNGKPIRHDTQADVTDDLHAVTAATKGQTLTVTFRTAGGSTRMTTIRPELVVINSDTTGSAPTGELVVTAINGQPTGIGDPSLVTDGATLSGFQEKPDGSPGKAFSGVVLHGVKNGFGAGGPIQAAWLIGVQAGSDGLPLISAVRDGFVAIPSFIHDTVTGIYHLVTTPSQGGLNGPQGLSGPVGIAQATVTAANGGGTPYLFWLGFVSMNLAFVNLIPIPFLDGGKLLFLLIEAVRRRRLDPRHEALAYAIGLALVVVFAVYVTIGDVGRL
jgi:regulator of sigma E protease